MQKRLNSSTSGVEKCTSVKGHSIQLAKRVLSHRREGTRIAEIEPNKFIGLFVQIGITLCKNSGIPINKISAQDKMMWATWARDFQERFGYLAEQELEIAVKSTTISEYEEVPQHYQIFSSDYVIKIFDQYRIWSKRKMSEAVRLEEEENPKPDTTPEKVESEFENQVIQNYRDYLEGVKDMLPHHGQNVIELLQEKGIAVYTIIQKKNFWNTAKAMMKKEAEAITKKGEAKSLVDMLKAIDTKVELSETAIKYRASTLAVYDTFEQLKNKKVTPEQLKEKASW